MFLTAYTIPVAPDGPNMPFGTPGLIFIDSLRLLIVVLGLVNLGLKPWLFRRCGSPGQMTRVAALGMMSIVGMSIELEHLGDYANWRLFFVLVAMIVNSWGNYSMLHYELPTRIRPDPRRSADQDAAARQEAEEEQKRFREHL